MAANPSGGFKRASATRPTVKNVGLYACEIGEICDNKERNVSLRPAVLPGRPGTVAPRDRGDFAMTIHREQAIARSAVGLTILSVVAVLTVVAVGVFAVDAAVQQGDKIPPPPEIDKSIPDIDIGPRKDEPDKGPAKPPEQAPDSKPKSPSTPNKQTAPGYSGGYGDQPGSGQDKPVPSSSQRDKLVKEIEKKLSAMTPVGSKQRGANDFFVFVTIEITKDHHVTVDYPVIQGVKEAAGKIADFLLRNEKAFHKWEVFARVKTMKAAQKQLALAKEKSIDAKLAAFPMSKKGAKKTPDDWFVVGTADLRLSDQHADIRLSVLHGIKVTAEFLLDYVLTELPGVKREWHVFYRFHTEKEANKDIEAMRKAYDELATKREELAKIYAAASTSRC